MSEFTLPPHDVHECGAKTDSRDIRTDDGLGQALRETRRAGSWDAAAGKDLLAEVRRRAVRNAAHVASATGVAMDRGLVDDVLLAAWMVLRQHGDKVAAAARPWAYLMSSAQKLVFDDVRAQQLLTNAASVRGRAREVMPRAVRPVGSTPTDLAAALRHEPRGASGEAGVDPRMVRQVGRHERPPLLEPSPPPSVPLREREPWFVAFVDLLVRHGADEDVTVAAVDRLADLFGVTYVGRWEWAARRDPVLVGLGLSADQCGALVALLAGLAPLPPQRSPRQPAGRRPGCMRTGRGRGGLGGAAATPRHLPHQERRKAWTTPGSVLARWGRCHLDRTGPMSIEAMAAVLSSSMGNGNGVRKLILLGYANHADKFGRDAYPSTQTVAEYAECDARTVRRHVGWLLSRGHLREGDQQAASHIQARHRPIVYDVAMSAAQIEEWSACPPPATGLRAKAVEAGRLGGRSSAQVSRGDTAVTRTLEPSREPSSSRPHYDRARDAADAPDGGGGDHPLGHALEVLPEAVRDHPSVIPSAMTKRIEVLDHLGWPRAEIRRRLGGVETADKLGAAALARLASLEQLDPPGASAGASPLVWTLRPAQPHA